MGFLKRISPLAKFSNFANINASIQFDIDEPDFLLKRKFSTVSAASKAAKRSKKYTSNPTLNACPKCGNAEISSAANYCKICGSEVSFK